MENDVTADGSETTAERHHIIEEDKLPSTNDNNVEDVQGCNEQSTDMEVEDLMAGICPEDMSFNASFIGLITPLKSKDKGPEPLHASTPNINSSDKSVTGDATTVPSTTPSKISKTVVEKVNKVLGPEFQGFKPSSKVRNTSLKECDQLTVYPKETFYGLPEDVSKYLEEFKGIKKLYGHNNVHMSIMCL